MLKLGNHFLVTTPLLIRVHAIPFDRNRWMEIGTKRCLGEYGFE